MTTELFKDYLTRFQSVPDLTLARKIYNENKESFKNLESVREKVRVSRGKKVANGNGKLQKDTTFFKPKTYDTNPFRIPESYAEHFEPFKINQTKTLILSDIHIPYHDKSTLDVALKYGKDRGANCVLINGDLLDMPQHSKHERDWRHRSTKQEFDATKQFLDYLRYYFPTQRIIFKHGNHDERWEKWLYIKAPEIFDDTYFHLEQRLQLNNLRIETVKDKLPIQLGKLNVLHGHELQGSGGVNPARATFLKTIDNVLIGHCHRSSQHTEPTFGGKIIVTTSQGCLCGMWPMFARVNKWNQGLSFCELDIKTGDYELDNLKIINGKIFK
jgi:predicted phosphodiesterase